MSPEDSDIKGGYSSDYAPYQKEILNEVCNAQNRTVVFMGPSQVGKTMIIKAAIGSRVHQNPAPMLIVEPSDRMAETFSKDRFMPMVRDVKVLTDLFGEQKQRLSSATILHKKFPGGHITFTGAGSAANLAMRPIGFVCFDEVDLFPLTAGNTGDPIGQAEMRTGAFAFPFSFYASTPSIEGASRIYNMMQETDQRKYYVPCPHCNHFQHLEWENLRYEERNNEVVRESIAYLCESCGERIPENKRHWMSAHGEWRSTRAGKKGFVGFWLGGLYHFNKTWENIINHYLEARKTPETYQVFWNSTLGRLWTHKGEAPDWERVYARREKYPFNKVPKGGSIILAGADVQDDRIEVEIKAYGANMENWSVDYRKIVGNTATPEPWAKLTELLNEPFPYEAGGESKIYRLAIDSGFRTVQVYNFARQFGHDRVMVVKGSSRRFAPMVSTPSVVDRTSRGDKLPGGVYLTMIGTDVIKHEIYQSLRQKKGDDLFMTMHFPDHEEQYFMQLTAESLILRTSKTGQKKYSWELPPGVRNEVLDCNVYVRACAALTGVDRWTPEHHEAFYNNIVRGGVKEQRQTKAPVQPPPQRRIRRSSLFDD